MKLWDNNEEIKFFKSSLKHFASPENLFYKLKNDMYAYIPKEIKEGGQTLQSRNSLIGNYTEKWARDFLSPLAENLGLFAVNSVVCPEISLPNNSPADLAFCTTDSKIQTPENIKIIFEIKMSIVSNYEYISNDFIKYLGDYKTHKGNPSLLRSDSMLKAIGKSVNIRTSSLQSSNIPIIIIGNSPITSSYFHKVDFLKKSGIVQGFWSLNPEPSKSDFIKETDKGGFRTFSDVNSVEIEIKNILSDNLNFFSSMISNKKLAEYIILSSKEKSNEEIALKFLSLIRVG